MNAYNVGVPIQFANSGASLGSFWKQWYPSSTAIDTLLERKDFTLEELLDEEDVLQELRGMNEKLLAYLSRPETLRKLLDYLMVPVEAPAKEATATTTTTASTTAEEKGAGKEEVDAVTPEKEQEEKKVEEDKKESTTATDEKAEKEVAAAPAKEDSAEPKEAPKEGEEPKETKEPEIAQEAKKDVEAETTKESAKEDAKEGEGSEESTEDAAEALLNKRRYKYPHMACEIFMSEMYPIIDSMFEHQDLIEYLFGFFAQTAPLSPLLSGYTSRVSSAMLQAKVEETMDIIKKREGYVKALLQHVESTAAMEIITKMIECEAATEGVHQILPWLREQGLVEIMIEKLSPQHSILIHENASNTLQDIIMLDSLYPSPLVAQLESKEQLEKLLALLLSPEAPESTLLNGISIIVALLKKPIDVASFDPTQEMDKLSPLMQTLVAHIEKLHALMKMDQKTLDDITANCNHFFPAQHPLGFQRLRLVELFANFICTGYHSVEQKLMEAGIVSTCLDLFFAYAFNNFLHSLVESMISIILEGDNEDLKLHLVTDAKLPQRICDASDLNQKAIKEKGNASRKGNMGHINSMAIKLLNLAPSMESLDKILREDERWLSFVKGPLTIDREKAKASPLDPVSFYEAPEDDGLMYHDGGEDAYEDEEDGGGMGSDDMIEHDGPQPSLLDIIGHAEESEDSPEEEQEPNPEQESKLEADDSPDQ